MTSQPHDLKARYKNAVDASNLELADELAAQIIALKRALKQ